MIPGKLATFSRRMLEVLVARYGKENLHYTEVTFTASGVERLLSQVVSAAAPLAAQKRRVCLVWQCEQLRTTHECAFYSGSLPHRLRIASRARQHVNL